MNFLPLRDHNIATENSSFTLVGDPKQSIYRFRGGNAEIMLDIINKKDFSPIEVEIETLQQNFRSAKIL
jgi:ATP-dependent exoDNAse (exonuclease V) beta subunit